MENNQGQTNAETTVKKKSDTLGIVLAITGVVLAVCYFGSTGTTANTQEIDKNTTTISQPTNEIATSETTDNPAIEILQHKKSVDAYIGVTTIYVVVRNNSNDLVPYLQINASFYDKNGGIVGTGMGNTTNLAAHAKRTIEVMATDIHGATSYSLDIENY